MTVTNNSLRDKEEVIRDFNIKVNSFFEGLTFVDKTHEYFINGKKIPISVSGLVKKFIKEVDWDSIAVSIAKREGVTKEVILKRWKDKNRLACDNGTKTHDFAENLTKDSKASTNKEIAVIKFWNDLEKQNPGRYILIIKEKRMYHKIYHFSGTGDFILYDTLTKYYIIGDYKTNEDLFKNYEGNLLLEPFGFLLDCPYNHYQIQLSLYQILLEQITNIIIGERWIIYLQDDCEFTKYNCYNYSDYLKSYFESRKSA